MAVLREFRCSFHDHEFESFEEHPKCPYGCAPQMVVLEFRTPPSFRSNSTKVNDALTRQLAADYNMTDVRGDKDGTSVMSNTRIESGGARVVGDKGKAYWNSEVFPVQHGWAARQEATPVFRPPASMTCAATPIKAINEGSRNYLTRATRFVGPKR